MRICLHQLAFTAIMTGAFACQSVDAQVHYSHRHHHHTHHHHHDAAGHRVDDAGHHIDRQGHHTGAVGVYDNGARSYPGSGTYNGRSGYWSNGGFYYASPSAVVIATQPQTYVQPQPYVPQQTYVQPQTYAQPLPGAAPQNYLPSNSLANGRPPQNVLPGAMNGSGQIIIFNPADSAAEVRYSLNGADYSIQPGYSQTLYNDRTWTVSFGSGGPKGDVRYTLSPGNFKFKITEDKMEGPVAHEYVDYE